MSDWKIGKPQPDEEAGWIGKAKISKTEIKKGAEIFGPKSENPDDDFCCIYVKRREKEVKIDQIRLFKDMSNVHPKSKAARFVSAYGSAPKVGKEVNVKTNADGFWELVL